MADSQYMLDAMLQLFPPGIERELEREPSVRWRMAFCLNYGRLLGNRTRNLEYNSALATLKTSLAEADINTRSNLWIFHPSPEVKNSGAASRKAAQLATDLLNRVIAEAPGTPWAIMASRELQNPFGIRVEERFSPPPGYNDTLDHFTNFFAAIRSRQPVIEDAVFGFRAAGPALLANLSYFNNRIYEWDPEAIKIKGEVKSQAAGSK